MSDESEQRLEAARVELGKEIANLKVRMLPRFRDVSIEHNEFGTGTATYVWFRYVLALWPSLLIDQVKSIIALSVLAGVAVGAVALAAGVGILRVLLWPFVQLLASVAGHLTIRYTPTTVREIYGESIRALPTYQEYARAGGKLDLAAIPVSPEMLASIQGKITDRAESDRRENDKS